MHASSPGNNSDFLYHELTQTAADLRSRTAVLWEWKVTNLTENVQLLSQSDEFLVDCKKILPKTLMYFCLLSI